MKKIFALSMATMLTFGVSCSKNIKQGNEVSVSGSQSQVDPRKS